LPLISSRQVFKLNTGEFPECTKITTHDLSDTTLLSSCAVIFFVCGELPSI
jgi:hypothetical protein